MTKSNLFLKLLVAAVAVTTAAPAKAKSAAAAPLPKPAINQKLQPEGIFRRRNEPQKMILLDSGIASLKKRLDMIAGAKKTIEAEYFIYSLDNSGRLLTQALVKKAREGVKVRLIVDTAFPIFELDNGYSAALMQSGIEVRYYNPSLKFQLVSMQYRSHRKSLIIDGREAITGGRNIADEYFDLDEEYNFADSDIHIRGSLVKDMQTSFEQFWSSNLAKPATRGFKLSLTPEKVMQKKIQAFLTTTDEDKDLLKKIHQLGGKLLAKEVTTTCHDTTFVADFPGMGEKTRVLREAIIKEAASARRDVYIESPYFVIKKNTAKVLRGFRDRGVTVKILTNSLYSTDAFYTQAALTSRMALYASDNVEFYFHNGEQHPSYPLLDRAKEARWGTHSKRAVFDGRTTMVGTFNVDPRSANINAEMALICRNNPELAQAVQKNMEKMMDRANKYGDGSDDNSNRHKIGLKKRILFWLTLPLANVFDFLL